MPKKLIVFEPRKAIDQIINNLANEKELSDSEKKMLGFVFSGMGEKELKAIDTFQRASAFLTTKITEVKRK